MAQSSLQTVTATEIPEFGPRPRRIPRGRTMPRRSLSRAAVVASAIAKELQKSNPHLARLRLLLYILQADINAAAGLPPPYTTDLPL